ncbi:sulfur carrier protein ThiS [Halobacillus andaensis]|uniref:Sulfur carrier protein ThiS n=1 Tax=Halobacillus andaensis TaxID=1176239 RepID=A0A917B8F1_HALAA|nr:sulfur carrier protein ThiS [Halobacillus andaensis]MBP2006432.1 sulfur carrier protein [Halobacillus andaensis]GGF27355.1 sulfur carrier protein ThiS [Halobacillus andaensis]
MNIQLNGRSIDFPKEEATIAELLESYRIQKKISVVEHNKEIVKKTDYERTKLADGDHLEIVHFVGGG